MQRLFWKLIVAAQYLYRCVDELILLPRPLVREEKQCLCPLLAVKSFHRDKKGNLGANGDSLFFFVRLDRS